MRRSRHPSCTNNARNKTCHTRHYHCKLSIHRSTALQRRETGCFPLWECVALVFLLLLAWISGWTFELQPVRYDQGISTPRGGHIGFFFQNDHPQNEGIYFWSTWDILRVLYLIWCFWCQGIIFWCPNGNHISGCVICMTWGCTVDWKMQFYVIFLAVKPRLSKYR